MKSVSPRHVEALIVDSLRLRDAAEVRRVLHGYPGLPGEKNAAETPETNADRNDDGNSSGKHDDGTTSKTRSRHTGGDDRNSNGMPELLAALSRAVEEEIRGTKGLFGLESGVLERLKGGARVTPFLRHGSVRRQESAGAAPHGLAAAGMKKWWRCPRCHISQVCYTL